MRLLLDTHALLWWLEGAERLGDRARAAVGAPTADVFVSSATAWEISIKKRLGKLEAPDDLPDQLVRHRFAALPVTIEHALAVGELPLHHRDPFDRMLVAQARLENLTIVTDDQRIRGYGVACVEAS